MKNVFAIVLGGISAFLSPVMDVKASETLFTIDAAITDLGGFHDTECQPEFEAWVVLTNVGVVDLVSADFGVYMNGIESYSYSWTGLLVPGASETVNVGICSVMEALNIMEVVVLNPNGTVDDNATNDLLSESFIGLPFSGMGLTINLTTDLWPQETSWVILHEGQVMFSSSVYADTLELSTMNYNFCMPPGCYEFIIYDSFGDGICCNFGEGGYELWDDQGNLLQSGGSFGMEEVTFICNETVSVQEQNEAQLEIYPNPGNGEINFEIPGNDQVLISIYDLNGKLVHLSTLLPGTRQLNLSDLSSGLYQVTCTGPNTFSSARLKIN